MAVSRGVSVGVRALAVGLGLLVAVKATGGCGSNANNGWYSAVGIVGAGSVSSATPNETAMDASVAACSAATSAPGTDAAPTLCIKGFNNAVDSITLTATPAPGWVFGNWTGSACDPGTDPTTTAYKSKSPRDETGGQSPTSPSCTARFVQQALEIDVEGVGTVDVVDPSGSFPTCAGVPDPSNPAQDPGVTKCNVATFDIGQSITLDESTVDPWQFAGWSGVCTGTAKQATFTFELGRTCTALFVLADGGVDSGPDQEAGACLPILEGCGYADAGTCCPGLGCTNGLCCLPQNTTGCTAQKDCCNDPKNPNLTIVGCVSGKCCVPQCALASQYNSGTCIVDSDCCTGQCTHEPAGTLYGECALDFGDACTDSAQCWSQGGVCASTSGACLGGRCCRASGGLAFMGLTKSCCTGFVVGGSCCDPPGTAEVSCATGNFCCSNNCVNDVCQ